MKTDAQGPIGRPPENGAPEKLEGALAPGALSSAAQARRPGLAALGGVLVVPLAALAAFAVLAFLLSDTPGKTLYYFFLGPFRNRYSFGNMLNSAVPLILGGLGVSAAMKAGHLNLGGEGQIYAGAFTATVAALALAPLGAAGGLLAIAAGAFTPGLAAALSGLCKARWNTSELITTFLLSNALILTVNYLVAGPFLDPQTNLQSTRKISEALRLPPILPPSSLSVSLFAALAAVVIVQIFLEKTRPGYELRMAGNNEIFARYGGINTKVNTVLALFISGAFYGLAGALAVFGTYYATVKEFSSGLGWNALAAALVARFYPPAVIPASLFFAWIASGARAAAQNADVAAETVSIAQAVIFFLATSLSLRDLFKRRKR
jgi:simple sugar transport system permease protein